MTTPTTETRPEYMTDDQLQAAYDDALAHRYQLEVTIPYDDESLCVELDAAEDRLLTLATEMQQRYRFTKHDGPRPPLPPPEL